MDTSKDLLNVFISYKRTDTEVVDRLEVDLRVRSFDTWLDRNDLAVVGGSSWKAALQKAIDDSHVIVLVVSPDAVESPFVRWEYRYALRIERRVIPVLAKDCPQGVPAELARLDWLDLRGAQYGDGLNELVAMLMSMPLHPPRVPAQPVPFGLDEPLAALVPLAPFRVPVGFRAATDDLDALFTDGVAAKASGNLDLAAALWGRIMQIDPGFQMGFVETQFHDLLQKIVQKQLKRLAEIASESRRDGQWGREIAAWQALLAINPHDQNARKALAAAQRNHGLADVYSKARRMLHDGKIGEARVILEGLWKTNADYGDPSGLAPQVGLPARPAPRPTVAAPVTDSQVTRFVESLWGKYNQAINNVRSTKPTTAPSPTMPAPDKSGLSGDEARKIGKYAGWGAVLGSIVPGTGTVIGGAIGAELGRRAIKKDRSKQSDGGEIDDDFIDSLG
jgi:hypothetical protein